MISDIANPQRQALDPIDVALDPLGFGLENYDVVGRWREEDAGKPIDARGVLPDLQLDL